MGLVSLCLGERLREGEVSVQPPSSPPNRGGQVRGMRGDFPRFCPVPEPPRLPHPAGLPLV